MENSSITDNKRFQINSKIIIKQVILDFEENKKSCHFLINLCLFDEFNLEKENVGKLLSVLSSMVYIDKDYIFHQYITNEINQIFQWNNEFEKYTLVRVIFRMGDLFCELGDLLHAWLYLLKAQEIASTIKIPLGARNALNEGLNKCNNQMMKDIKRKDHDYLTKREEFIIAMKGLDDMFQRIKNNELVLPDKINKVYLISVKWVTNFLVFWNKYTQCSNNELSNFVSYAFDMAKVFDNYFRESNIEPDASYPYKINNYDLIDFMDHWKDPSKKKNFENVYLKKDMIEGKDYYCITKNEWAILKDIFSATNRIIRYRSNIHLNQYDIYLKELEILIIESTMKAAKMNLIKIKKIQFSKETTILELIEKIKRCLELKQENLIYQFYSIPLKNKEVLVNLLIAFSMNCIHYQMSFNELNVNNDDLASILTLPNYDNEKQLIILELSPNKTTQFLTVNTQICSNCFNSIISSPVRCPNCYYNYFCSKKCLDTDDYHKSVHDYIYWIPQFSSLQTIPLRKFLNDSNNNNGRTGLKNLRFSCYMNSAIQCLSNTDDLTKYFLSRTHRKEINGFNTFGTKGKFSEVYEELIDNLWNKSIHCFVPSRLIEIIHRKTNRFGEYTMQDAQEFLIFLLDYLHEDVNRINNKLYIEMYSQKHSETDEEASKRWWNCHKKREDSIIVDLFHGQYKSSIQCPDCQYKNITYDPFLFMSLPIPIEEKKYKYTFIRLNHVCYKRQISFNNNINITLLEIYNDITTSFDFKIDSIEALVFEKNKSLYEIISQKIIMNSLIKEGKEIIFYEKETKKDYYMLYVYPIKLINSFFSFFDSTPQIAYLSYPLGISVKINSSLEDLCYVIYDSISHILYSNSLIDIRDSLQSNQQNSKINTLPFKIHLPHRISPMWFESFKCNFCNDTKLPFCNILSQFGLQTSLKKIIFNNVNQLPLLYVEIPTYDKSKKLYNNMTIPLNSNPDSSSIITKSDDFTIYDCIELFTAKERLSKDNKWYCPECKKHQEAMQKCDIYKAPNYLIIHLKRFHVYSVNSTFSFNVYQNNKKNNAFVKYPIEGLNLNNYILGNSSNELYDLYGVINHYGTIDKGHYIAVCKNFGEWIQYNDDQLSLKSANDVINANAYLLFYKKRSSDNNN